MPVFAGMPTICRRKQAFDGAVDALMALGNQEKTTILCAEAVPWRCHRSLIADALVSRSWDIRHIMSPEKAMPHVLTSFAHFEAGVLTYPKPTDPFLLF